MKKHGQAEMVQKRGLMMTRTDAAEVATGVWGVAQVQPQLPWGLMGQMSTTGQLFWGRSPMRQGGLPGDGLQDAGQLALEGLSMLLGLSLGGA